MALSRGNLAFIQLAATKGDIYDPAASTTGLIHNILLHNTNTTSEIVELNYHDGTNEYLLFKITLIPDETVQLDFRGEGLVIASTTGAKLTGNTTTAAKVTCKVDGTEET